MRITDGSREVLVSTPTIKTEREFRAAYAKGQLQADGEIDVRSAQAAFDETILLQVNFDEAACVAQVAEAQRDGFRNLGALHWALGPEIYQLRQDYQDVTYRNYYRALEKMLEHVVSRRKQRVLLSFASGHNYPAKLTPSQQSSLKTELMGAFDHTSDSNALDLPATWNLNPEFSDLCLRIAATLLTKESAKCESTAPSADLSKTLFNEKNHASDLQIALTELAQQQRNLHRKYNNDVAKAWSNFRRKFASLRAVDQRIVDLKARGIAELSINDLAGGPALFDSAVHAYVTAKSDDQKKASLACLQELVAHGAKPTDENATQLDALALSKLLPLGAAPTAQVKAARAELTAQLESQTGFFSWAWTLLYRSEARADSLAAAQKGVALFLASRELPFSAEQAKMLLTAAAQPKAELGNPGLRIFDRAPTTDERGRLLTHGTELPRLTYGTS